MQVAKYWRNKKLRYRLEGMPRQEDRALVLPRSDARAEGIRRQAPKREPSRLPQ